MGRKKKQKDGRILHTIVSLFSQEEIKTQTYNKNVSITKNWPAPDQKAFEELTQTQWTLYNLNNKKLPPKINAMLKNKEKTLIAYFQEQGYRTSDGTITPLELPPSPSLILSSQSATNTAVNQNREEVKEEVNSNQVNHPEINFRNK